MDLEVDIGVRIKNGVELKEINQRINRYDDVMGRSEIIDRFDVIDFVRAEEFLLPLLDRILIKLTSRYFIECLG